MSDLISRKYLYDKMVEMEELARDRVLDTPSNSPAYIRYVAQLKERTALKHEIADAPSVTDTNVGGKWIPCSERLPEPYKAVLVSTSTGEIDVDYYGSYCKDFMGLKGTHMKAIAWMPLPEPYKGE